MGDRKELREDMVQTESGILDDEKNDKKVYLGLLTVV